MKLSIEQLYLLYSSKNINSGIRQESNYFLTNTKNSSRNNRYIIPHWLIDKEDDKICSYSEFIKTLDSLSLTVQMFYDIVVLGLTSPTLRPKCLMCGKDVKFISFSVGYSTFCSRNCKSKYEIRFNTAFTDYNRGGKAKRGLHHSAETRKKISKSNKGKRKYIPTQETKDKLSKKFKNRKITWKDKLRKAALDRIEKNPEAALKFVKSRGKSSIYFSKKANKEIRCLSTWEEKFLKMCDFSKDIIQVDTVYGIPYTYLGRDHIYIPDFKLVLDTGITVIVEIKPHNLVNDPVVIAKRIAAKKYCKKAHYKYITLTEIELFKHINGSFSIYDFII